MDVVPVVISQMVELLLSATVSPVIPSAFVDLFESKLEKWRGKKQMAVLEK